MRVDVTAKGMRFVPAEVHVKRGDRLVVHLTNGDTSTHDLAIGASRTPRVAPGKDAELDVGVIGASVQGFCSVAGHRQMGMVFDVVVDDAAATAPTVVRAGASPSSGGMSGMDETKPATSG